jgi:hypothetical protein
MYFLDAAPNNAALLRVVARPVDHELQGRFDD